MENTQNETQNISKEELSNYLDNNGLIAKWEVSGLFDQVKTNSEKYLIASVMEAMIYRSFEMVEKEGKSSDEMMAFQEKYMGYMAKLGVFNGGLMSQVI